MVTAIRRIECTRSSHPSSAHTNNSIGDVKDKALNQNFSALFHSFFTSLLFKFRDATPVCICSLRTDIQIPDESSVELIMNAVAVLLHKPNKNIRKKVCCNAKGACVDGLRNSLFRHPHVTWQRARTTPCCLQWRSILRKVCCFPAVLLFSWH